MKRRRIVMTALLILGASMALAQTFGVKKRTPKPDEYGTVVMSNFAARVDSDPVVFPHWLHRIRFKCSSCHPHVFEMKAGANPITMDALRAGEFCARCHNGQIAWEVGFTTCVNCHESR